MYLRLEKNIILKIVLKTHDSCMRYLLIIYTCLNNIVFECNVFNLSNFVADYRLFIFSLIACEYLYFLKFLQIKYEACLTWILIKWQKS